MSTSSLDDFEISEDGANFSPVSPSRLEQAVAAPFPSADCTHLMAAGQMFVYVGSTWRGNP